MNIKFKAKLDRPGLAIEAPTRSAVGRSAPDSIL